MLTKLLIFCTIAYGSAAPRCTDLCSPSTHTSESLTGFGTYSSLAQQQSTLHELHRSLTDQLQSSRLNVDFDHPGNWTDHKDYRTPDGAGQVHEEAGQLVNGGAKVRYYKKNYAASYGSGSNNLGLGHNLESESLLQDDLLHSRNLGQTIHSYGNEQSRLDSSRLQESSNTQLYNNRVTGANNDNWSTFNTYGVDGGRGKVYEEEGQYTQGPAKVRYYKKNYTSSYTSSGSGAPSVVPITDVTNLESQAQQLESQLNQLSRDFHHSQSIHSDNSARQTEYGQGYTQNNYPQHYNHPVTTQQRYEHTSQQHTVKSGGSGYVPVQPVTHFNYVIPDTELENVGTSQLTGQQTIQTQQTHRTQVEETHHNQQTEGLARVPLQHYNYGSNLNTHREDSRRHEILTEEQARRNQLRDNIQYEPARIVQAHPGKRVEEHWESNSRHRVESTIPHHIETVPIGDDLTHQRISQGSGYSNQATHVSGGSSSSYQHHEQFGSSGNYRVGTIDLGHQAADCDTHGGQMGQYTRRHKRDIEYGQQRETFGGYQNSGYGYQSHEGHPHQDDDRHRHHGQGRQGYEQNSGLGYQHQSHEGHPHQDDDRHRHHGQGYEQNSGLGYQHQSHEGHPHQDDDRHRHYGQDYNPRYRREEYHHEDHDHRSHEGHPHQDDDRHRYGQSYEQNSGIGYQQQSHEGHPHQDDDRHRYGQGYSQYNQGGRNEYSGYGHQSHEGHPHQDDDRHRHYGQDYNPRYRREEYHHEDHDHKSHEGHPHQDDDRHRHLSHDNDSGHGHDHQSHEGHPHQDDDRHRQYGQDHNQRYRREEYHHEDHDHKSHEGHPHQDDDRHRHLSHDNDSGHGHDHQSHEGHPHQDDDRHRHSDHEYRYKRDVSQYDFDQQSDAGFDFGQNTEKLELQDQKNEKLNQETQGIDLWHQQAGNLELGQQTEDLSQQTHQFDFGQQTEDLSQQWHKLDDFSHHQSGRNDYGRRHHDLETGNLEFGQQTEDLSQQTHRFEDYNQRQSGTHELGQHHHKLETGNLEFGQQTEDLSQQTHQFDFGQQTEDLSQQSHQFNDFNNHQSGNHEFNRHHHGLETGSLELGQQTTDSSQQNHRFDFGQQTEDLSQQSHQFNDLNNHQSGNHEFGRRHHNLETGNLEFGQQTEDLSQQTHKFEDYNQHQSGIHEFGQNHHKLETGNLEFGQQTEDLSQQTHRFDFGQQTEDSSHQSHRFDDFSHHSENHEFNRHHHKLETGNLEFGQQTEDLSQQTHKLDDFNHHQSRNHELDQHHQLQTGNLEFGQQTEDLSQQTHKLDDFNQHQSGNNEFGQHHNQLSTGNLEFGHTNSEVDQQNQGGFNPTTNYPREFKPAPKPTSRPLRVGNPRGDTEPELVGPEGPGSTVRPVSPVRPVRPVKGGRAYPPRVLPAQYQNEAGVLSLEEQSLAQESANSWHQSHHPSDLTSDNQEQSQVDSVTLQSRILEVYGGKSPYEAGFHGDYSGVKPNPSATLAPQYYGNEPWEIREAASEKLSVRSAAPLDAVPESTTELYETTPAPGFWKKLGNKITNSYEKAKEKINTTFG